MQVNISGILVLQHDVSNMPLRLGRKRWHLHGRNRFSTHCSNHGIHINSRIIEVCHIVGDSQWCHSVKMLSKIAYVAHGVATAHTLLLGCNFVRWLFGSSMVGLLVVLFVPLFLSFLAMPGLWCFLCVTPTCIATLHRACVP